MGINDYHSSDFPSHSKIGHLGLVKARNDARWESLRENIYRTYVEGKRTLEKTMEIIETEHGFKASKRKWKDKLKEWHYDKYLSKDEMKIIVAKKEKRKAEGKESTFMHGATEIPAERIESFKRRKVVKMESTASPYAETPANITYHTPLSYENNYIEEEATNDGKDLSLESEDNIILPGFEQKIELQSLDETAHDLQHGLPDLSKNTTIPLKDVKHSSKSPERKLHQNPTGGVCSTSEGFTHKISPDHEIDVLAIELRLLEIAKNLSPDAKLPHVDDAISANIAVLSSLLASGYFTSKQTPLLYDHDSSRSMMDRSTLVNFLVIHCTDVLPFEKYNSVAIEAKKAFRQVILAFNSRLEINYRAQALLCQYYLDTTFKDQSYFQAVRESIEMLALAITLGGDYDSGLTYTEVEKRLITGWISTVQKLCGDGGGRVSENIVTSLSQILQEIKENKCDVRETTCGLFATIVNNLQYLRYYCCEDELAGIIMSRLDIKFHNALLNVKEQHSTKINGVNVDMQKATASIYLRSIYGRTASNNYSSDELDKQSEASSYEYGLTYSVSEITGVSNSCFMTP
ncbi:hypothetical protein OCU04_011007 [Sclerotinia nivalis]|uniref:Clr5 domain-containing protein n=1 Tax=Sclerotinia nivalis TaxID=352851 RepID=A0A9X0AD89_9HELO|nr:hypothetical protein OCU04_011007 [Sclerotinia nivalis]